MKKIITGELEKIERENNVKILYAVESGSRSWGFPSKDSDYDVRFIYVHPMEWYLTIDEKRDVIELPINDVLDINGWDLRKALQLLRKSNPPLLEWIASPIVYFENQHFIETLKEVKEQSFKPEACMFHYLNMAKNNYRDYLQRDEVKIKKYFYVIRPILACQWIEKYATTPPVEFETLLHELVEDQLLHNEITMLLDRKKRGDEMDLEPRIEVINTFIESEITRLEEVAKKFPKTQTIPTDVFDSFFQSTLHTSWEK